MWDLTPFSEQRASVYAETTGSWERQLASEAGQLFLTSFQRDSMQSTTRVHASKASTFDSARRHTSAFLKCLGRFTSFLYKGVHEWPQLGACAPRFNDGNKPLGIT